MDRVLLISSDCHAGIPIGQYRPYLEKRFQNELDDYKAVLDSLYRETGAFSEEIVAERTAVSRRCSFTDSAGRLADLEENGVVSEVLFPAATGDTSPPWSDFLSRTAYRARTVRQREYQAAGERAYNRWLTEFCQAVPDNRRLGLALLPIHDVDAAVAEVHWAADNGLRGVVLPFFNYDLPEYVHGWYWDSIWRACEERGLSLNFHGGHGYPDLGHRPNLMLREVFFAERAISHLVMTGVFDRFPKLRFSVTERLADWVPRMFGELDENWEGAAKGRSYSGNDGSAASGQWMAAEDFPERRPSEYWPTNGFVGVSITNLHEMESRHEIGVEQMMYGIDYPHPEGSWGHATTWLQATLGLCSATEREARLILGENAARLYNVDVRALAADTERVGPTVDEVLTRASAQDVDSMLDEMTHSGRELAAVLYSHVGTPTPKLISDRHARDD